MSDLLEWKERVRHFYGKYEVYIVPVIKFVLAFIAFFLIGKNIGYLEKVNNIPMALVGALICAVLPVNAIILIGMAVVLLNLYALSLEVCAVAFVIFLIIGLIYFRFAPKDGYYTVLTPICFALHIPYAVPMAAGLLKAPYSMIPVAGGTIVYYFLAGVKENEVLLGKVQEEGAAATSKFVVAFNQLLGNKEMYVVLAAFVLMILLVYAIRRMSIDHSWTIAIITGVLAEFIVLFSGFMVLGISGKTIWLIVGNVISIVIGLILQFLFFNLDYTRTERVQFEDDEYYYYVKAVPKMYVTTTEKHVKSFGGGRERERISREELAEEMDIDKDLLDL